MVKGRPVAIVTGAARGIGKAVAARLASEGYALILADVDSKALARAFPAEAEDGDRMSRIAADCASEAGVEAVLAEAHAAGRLDALVCNAGIMIRKPVTDLRLDEWHKVIDTNLTSAFLFARLGAGLLRSSAGSIVLIASTRAHMSEPDTEAYSASKGGLVALGHALAISLAPSVRVNVVSPGWIETKGETLTREDHLQHPVGRVGHADDIAACVAWLVGAQSGFVSGAEFIIDGGMTRKMIYV